MKKILLLLILLITFTGCTNTKQTYTNVENALPSFYDKGIKSNSRRYFHYYYAETPNGDIRVEINRYNIDRMSVKSFFIQNEYENISSGVYKGYDYIRGNKGNLEYVVVLMKKPKYPFVAMGGIFEKGKEKEFIQEFEDYIKRYEENYKMISNM